MTISQMTNNSQLNEKFGYTTISPQESVYNPTTVESADKRRSRIASLTAECCYSISNLALIIACVAALAVLIKFNSSLDDPLYEYGEHLLSRRFYYQLIYIIVIVALVLLVPLYNAASALFLSPGKTDDAGRSILVMKIIYQILMLILVFIALVFVSPYIKASNLSNQIELELIKHIKYRYDQPVSYEMLNSLQDEYQCCDELWYRANLGDKLPISCFVPESNYGRIYEITCASAISSVVSSRCIVIGVALIIILVALICLIINDYKELPNYPKRQYEVSQRKADESQQLVNRSQNTTPDNDEHDSNCVPKMVDERRVSNGTRQQAKLLDEDSTRSSTATVPLLLASSRRANSPQTTVPKSLAQIDFEDDDELDEEQFREQLINVQQSKSPTILARANYHIVERSRSQSPVFLSKRPDEGGNKSAAEAAAAGDSTRPTTPTIKSALKKTPSTQRVDSNSREALSSASSSVDDADSLHEYAERLRTSSLLRQHETKRSLLNVRFADS